MSKELALQRSKEQQRRIKQQNDAATAKHTPGPWGYEYEPDGDNHFIWSASGDRVATAFPFSITTTEANARLIAAAPELLQILQELTQSSAYYWGEYDVPIGIVERINTAISKATGEAP